MAMYEDLGFCPNNSFTHYAMSRSSIYADEDSGLRIIYDVLGDRKGYMVYANDAIDGSFYWSSIIEAFFSIAVCCSTAGIYESNIVFVSINS